MKWSNGILVFLYLLLTANAWGATCQLVTVSVNFGEVDRFLPSPRDANGEVDVTCSSGVAFTVKIDPGLHSGSSFFSRKVKKVGALDTLNYNLYRDATRVQVWGDGTGGSFVQMGMGTGGLIPIPVYGRFPAGQNVGVGVYVDSVTVTVEF